MRFYYDKISECQNFWSWLIYNWLVFEKGVRKTGWRFCGIVWDRSGK